MPIYTGTGDHGQTGLFGNRRVAKDHSRIEAYGTVDELATEGGKACLARIEPAILEIERWIDASEAMLPPLRTFVLPGGCRVAGLLHVLRTVSRRAERCFWTAARLASEPDGTANPIQPIPPQIGIYLNRLSDLFFTWARRANLQAGVADVPWHRAGQSPG